MEKAKQALLKAGRIEAIGRGRISLENHAWLKEQYDSGVRFSDWPKGDVVTVVAGQANPDAAPQVRVIRDPNAGTEKVVREYTILYDEKAYQAVSDNGKVYGMREVCNTCRVSLVQNVCENPTILGDIKVTIKARA